MEFYLYGWLIRKSIYMRIKKSSILSWQAGPLARIYMKIFILPRCNPTKSNEIARWQTSLSSAFFRNNLLS